MSTPTHCPKLEQIIREHVRDCPEDIGHVLAWALNISSGAHAIGMPSGPIEPALHPAGHTVRETPKRVEEA